MRKLFDYILNKIADRVLERIRLNTLRMKVLDIQPGDILVVKSDAMLYPDAREAIRVQMEGLFPENLVIIMDRLDLSLIRPRLRVGNGART